MNNQFERQSVAEWAEQNRLRGIPSSHEAMIAVAKSEEEARDLVERLLAADETDKRFGFQGEDDEVTELPSLARQRRLHFHYCLFCEQEYDCVAERPISDPDPRATCSQFVAVPHDECLEKEPLFAPPSAPPPGSSSDKS